VARPGLEALTTIRPSDRGNWNLLQLIGLAFGALLSVLITRTMADPDLWGHLRFGLDLLVTRAIPISDRYSFTSDRAWVNHEWLSELLMGVAYSYGGVWGLNLLKLAALASLIIIVGAVLRQERAPAGIRNLLLGLTLFATYTRMQVIRPQIFAVVMFAFLLYVLRQVDRGTRRAIWLVPVCFIFWVNLHGSWIVGLAVTSVWLAAALCERRSDRGTAMLLAAGAATMAATFVNPYGTGLWRFLIETVRFQRVDISEWQPLAALPPLILAVEAVLPALALISLSRVRQRVPFPYVAVLLILWIATFRTSRVDAFAQEAIVILLARDLVAGLGSINGSLRAPFWRAAVPLGPIPAMVVAACVLGGAWRMREIPVEGSWIPDLPAAVFLREQAPGARLLTWFDWGEYAIWQLAPAGIEVSIDGRRETVYSADVLARHWAFYRGATDGLDYPDEIRADYIWLPVHLPVVNDLRGRGWNPVFESSRSVVFARHARDDNAPAISSDGVLVFP
jgi:hypothetical protein